MKAEQERRNDLLGQLATPTATVNPTTTMKDVLKVASMAVPTEWAPEMQAGFAQVQEFLRKMAEEQTKMDATARRRAEESSREVQASAQGAQQGQPTSSSAQIRVRKHDGIDGKPEEGGNAEMPNKIRKNTMSMDDEIEEATQGATESRGPRS